MPEQDQVVFGGFWKRLCALLIDGLIILPLLVPFDWLDKTTWKSPALHVLLFLFPYFYYVFFLSKYQATPGKMIMKLKVVNQHLEKIGLTHALLRNSLSFAAGLFSLYFTLKLFHRPEFLSVHTMKEYLLFSKTYGDRWIGSTVSLGVVLIETIFLLVDHRKRALHDHIAGTMVIEQR